MGFGKRAAAHMARQQERECMDKCPVCNASCDGIILKDRCGCGANLRAIRAERDAEALTKRLDEAVDLLQAMSVNGCAFTNLIELRDGINGWQWMQQVKAFLGGSQTGKGNANDNGAKG